MESLETAIANGMLVWIAVFVLPTLFVFWFMVAVVSRLRGIDNSLKDIGELIGDMESKMSSQVKSDALTELLDDNHDESPKLDD